MTEKDDVKCRKMGELKIERLVRDWRKVWQRWFGRQASVVMSFWHAEVVTRHLFRFDLVTAARNVSARKRILDLFYRGPGVHAEYIRNEHIRGGDAGGRRPSTFRQGGTRPPLPHFFGLKFVQKLVHCCNWLLTETQCKIILVQQN